MLEVSTTVLDSGDESLVCDECGRHYGKHQGVMSGIAMGTCSICGGDAAVQSARYVYGMDDEAVAKAMADYERSKA